MRRTTLAGITALCAGSLVAVVGAPAATAAPRPAVAVAAAPAAVPAETTITLPLFGAPLTVDISSGPGGALTDVSINPADGFTATTVKPNKVRFVNEDGTARVDVVSNHGSQRVSARAGQLGDLVGPGSWSGDLFGTGTTTTVNFEIVALADGSPDITNITTSDPTAEIGAVAHGDDDDGQGAFVRILFTSGIQARSLFIGVTVEAEDDDDDSGDDSTAKLSIRLSRTFGQTLPSDQVVGPQTWTGLLCDGTPATINYTVNADGTLSDVTTTPEASVNTNDHKIDVSFSDHERVRIRLRSHDDEMQVSVKERIRCDSADPTVNTPISVGEPDDDEGDDNAQFEDHDDDDHDDHEGDHDGHGEDDGGSDDDGGSSSSNGS
jgi:hypothetical protein